MNRYRLSNQSQYQYSSGDPRSPRRRPPRPPSPLLLPLPPLGGGRRLGGIDDAQHPSQLRLPGLLGMSESADDIEQREHLVSDRIPARMPRREPPLSPSTAPPLSSSAPPPPFPFFRGRGSGGKTVLWSREFRWPRAAVWPTKGAHQKEMEASALGAGSAGSSPSPAPLAIAVCPRGAASCSNHSFFRK